MSRIIISNNLHNIVKQALTNEQGFDFEYTFWDKAIYRCFNHLVETSIH